MKYFFNANTTTCSKGKALHCKSQTHTVVILRWCQGEFCINQVWQLQLVNYEISVVGAGGGTHVPSPLPPPTKTLYSMYQLPINNQPGM